MVAPHLGTFGKLILPQLVEQPHPGIKEAMERIARSRIPRIERRRNARAIYRTQAWLQAIDATGAVRPPMIHTRDLDTLGLGFISKHDLSVLAEGELHLPAANGRPVRVICAVRRSREFGGGWYEGFVEFKAEQPLFTPRRRMDG